jgi:hypothetical protein
MSMFERSISLKQRVIGIICVAFIVGAYTFTSPKKLNPLTDYEQSIAVQDSFSHSNTFNDPSSVYALDAINNSGNTHVKTMNHSITQQFLTSDNASVVDNKYDEKEGASDITEANEQLYWFAGMDLNELFKDSAFNQHTLNVATLFQSKFNDSMNDLDFHYRQVENDLVTLLNDNASVEEFLSFYRDYSEFAISQMYDPQPLWLEDPESIDEAISLNKAKQQYRRSVFGYDVADQVWGTELKEYEYKISAMKIVDDENYGPDMAIKGQLIADLQTNTWEVGELDSAESMQIELYTKVASHGEELLKMTTKERNAKINEFRLEIFPEKEAIRLNQIEDEMMKES